MSRNESVSAMMTRRHRTVSGFLITVSFICSDVAHGWTLLPTPAPRSGSVSHRHRRGARRAPPSRLGAKRRKPSNEDDLYDWYDSVDAAATPDDVFWQEVERQRQVSQVQAASRRAARDGGTAADTAPPAAAAAAAAAVSLTLPTTPTAPVGTSGNWNKPPKQAAPSFFRQSEGAAPPPLKSVDSVLAEYAAFAVADNWLDDEIRYYLFQEEQRNKNNVTDGRTVLNAAALSGGAADDPDSLAYLLQSDDPWAQYGMSPDLFIGDAIRIDPSRNPDVWYDPNKDDGEEVAQLEAAMQERLSKIKTWSPSLERARNSSRAAAFFRRGPNALEGCDRMWVAAVDSPAFKNIRGLFGSYGVDFACNFGDFEDGCLEDGLVSIEDMASFKARKVFEVTGLPCIATRTSFEIEPIPNFDPAVKPPNPRIASGYRFNDVGAHVDAICDSLRPFSEPTRVTQFKMCFCYYDGAMEVYDYGVLDCDLEFAHSIRTYVAMAHGMNKLVKTLELTFGLEYMAWLNPDFVENADPKASAISKASVKLRDRILKDGRVLPNNIVDVSAFMDSKIDVDLMEECAQDLADRCMMLQPTKILTVATTGLVVALAMGKHMSVDVVYARKERSMVMADTYEARYSSKTIGKERQLFVSTKHLEKSDRILIVDDFLSSGSSQEALLRIIAQSGATTVGIAVLLEKVYLRGRESLSGFELPIESLCRIASVKDGVIQMLEEKGYSEILNT